MSSGVATPASANQPSASERVTSRVPPRSSSSWVPASSSLWRVRSSSGSVGRYQSRATSQPPGLSAAHAERIAADRVRQLVERVLEVGQRRLALVADGGDVARARS